MTNPAEDTTADRPLTAEPTSTPSEAQVSGGEAERMDSAGPGSGGLPGAGADGETVAREALRQDLGERSEGAGTETGSGLGEGLGATDDPEGGSIQAHGSSS